MPFELFPYMITSYPQVPSPALVLNKGVAFVIDTNAISTEIEILTLIVGTQLITKFYLNARLLFIALLQLIVYYLSHNW